LTFISTSALPVRFAYTFVALGDAALRLAAESMFVTSVPLAGSITVDACASR
jgi:hypothetical protein